MWAHHNSIMNKKKKLTDCYPFDFEHRWVKTIRFITFTFFFISTIGEYVVNINKMSSFN